MSKRSRKEQEKPQSMVIRVLAFVLAALLIGMIVAEVLPVFGLAEQVAVHHTQKQAEGFHFPAFVLKYPE